MRIDAALSDEVHVWFVRPESRLLDADLALLSFDELDRAARFHFERDRRIFIAAHALVRRTLSRHVPIDPRSWRFATNEHGRPEPILSNDQPPLRFNLSHTIGLVACAVALTRDVGVDVENLARDAPLDIAERYFSSDELAGLRALPADQQPDRFFTYWTLKEAYIKAVGLGLAIPLDGFTFLMQPGKPIRVSFAAPLEDDSSGWQFDASTIAPRHRIAVAVRRRGPDLPIRIAEDGEW